MKLLNNCSTLYCKNFTMNPANSSAPTYKLRGLVTLLCQYRVCSSNPGRGTYPRPNLDRGIGSSFSKFGYVNEGTSIQRRSLSMFSANNVSHKTPGAIPANPINKNVQPSVPPPPRPRAWYLTWGKWLLGSFIPVFVAFMNQKWNNLRKLEGEVQQVAKEVEEAAKVVEEVATATEKVSAEIAGELSDGRLKDAAEMIEHLASVTAKDAQITEEFIDKLGDLEQDLKDLEKIAEPAINKTVQAEHGEK